MPPGWRHYPRRVDERDTETFSDYNSDGLFPDTDFNDVNATEEFSPPTETRHWFMLGGIRTAAGDWQMPDFSGEYFTHPSSDYPTEMLGGWVYEGDETAAGQSC
jgi:hypothetical protein